uniref:Uncharacterized protein n=1 Tax=Arundo donax TaxID=35708 RepID=A0A0A8ZQU1_ARUDO
MLILHLLLTAFSFASTVEWDFSTLYWKLSYSLTPWMLLLGYCAFSFLLFCFL